MGFMTDKFKGIYRLRTPYDTNTNTFPRDTNGNYSDHDIYIDCLNNIQIFYYGNRGVLQAYIPSLGRGRNIVKQIYSDYIKDVNSSTYSSKCIIMGKEGYHIEYESLYKDSELNKIIFDIEETDEEVLFKFKWTLMNDFEKYLKPKTSAADRSPFSSKNLPKSDYTIPDEDIAAYKNIVSTIPKEDALKLGRITSEYIKSLGKSKKKQDEIKADMKKKMLKSKEYIHCIGKWDAYLKYLESEIKKLC